MRIVVLIKPGSELDESDACAVEAALGVARRRIDVGVSVLTAGPADCLTGLRAALALGADDGVHVLDDELTTTDALALSRVLAAAVRRHGFDLVLCGAESEAPNLAALPVMIAERLDLPALCDAETVGTSADGTEIFAVCDAAPFALCDGGEVVERAARPPALVSVSERAAAPRYPAFPAVAEARRKLVRTWTTDSVGIDPATVRRRAAATVVSSSVLCPRTHTIVTAGADPRAAAARLADFLDDRRFL
jgi:electron transfer flavoprotein beta subunit